MKYKPVRDRYCQNEKCRDHWKFNDGSVIRHSMYKTRQGRRRRYLCKTCEKTVCSTKGTPYYRLHKSRLDFDEVVQMTVEGVGISSISRIKCFSWNTIASWQYLACQVAGEFNDHKLNGAELIELQADETRTPAMQAGLVKKQISFREIFMAVEIIFWWVFMFLRTWVRVEKFTWISA